MLKARTGVPVQPRAAPAVAGCRRDARVITRASALPAAAGQQQAARKHSSSSSSAGLRTNAAVVASPIAEPVPQPALPMPPAPNSIVELNPSTYQDFITKEAGDALVLVDFYSNHCGPCKLMDSHLHHLTFAFKGIKFAKFNCGLHPEFSTGLRIRSLPTFRLYHRRQCLEQLTGAQPVKLRQLLVHYFRPSRK